MAATGWGSRGDRGGNDDLSCCGGGRRRDKRRRDIHIIKFDFDAPSASPGPSSLFQSPITCVAAAAEAAVNANEIKYNRVGSSPPSVQLATVLLHMRKNTQREEREIERERRKEKKRNKTRCVPRSLQSKQRHPGNGNGSEETLDYYSTHLATISGSFSCRAASNSFLALSLMTFFHSSPFSFFHTNRNDARHTSRYNDNASLLVVNIAAGSGRSGRFPVVFFALSRLRSMKSSASPPLNHETESARERRRRRRRRRRIRRSECMTGSNNVSVSLNNILCEGLGEGKKKNQK